jgi:hypothetical protein
MKELVRQKRSPRRALFVEDDCQHDTVLFLIPLSWGAASLPQRSHRHCVAYTSPPRIYSIFPSPSRKVQSRRVYSPRTRWATKRVVMIHLFPPLPVELAKPLVAFFILVVLIHDAAARFVVEEGGLKVRFEAGEQAPGSFYLWCYAPRRLALTLRHPSACRSHSQQKPRQSMQGGLTWHSQILGLLCMEEP